MIRIVYRSLYLHNHRQDNWDKLLPLAEFQYNNHVHSATQMVPFLVDTGRLPQMGFEPRTKSQIEVVNRFVERMKESTQEAKAALQKAKDDMAMYYNRKHIPTPEFQPGDRVFIDAQNLKTTRPLQKLNYHFIDPYVVERKVGTHAY